MAASTQVNDGGSRAAAASRLVFRSGEGTACGAAIQQRRCMQQTSARSAARMPQTHARYSSAYIRGSKARHRLIRGWLRRNPAGRAQADCAKNATRTSNGTKRGAAPANLLQRKKPAGGRQHGRQKSGKEGVARRRYARGGMAATRSVAYHMRASASKRTPVNVSISIRETYEQAGERQLRRCYASGSEATVAQRAASVQQTRPFSVSSDGTRSRDTVRFHIHTLKKHHGPLPHCILLHRRRRHIALQACTQEATPEAECIVGTSYSMCPKAGIHVIGRT